MRLVAALVLLASTSACSPPRDFVPETHDVRGADAAAPDDYLYVARREHGVIGVVATREMSVDDAKRIADKLADDLEVCSRNLQASGKLAVGAAKLTAGASQKGTGEIGEIRLAPGSDVAANALLCLAAPIRTTNFPQGSSLLLEATWNPVRSGNAPAPASDAGGSL